jgi:translation initiation factor 1 (eIF-1/SUI1)
MSKKRIDTRTERRPLTDNPFGNLTGMAEKLPRDETLEKPQAATPTVKAPYRVGRTRNGGWPVGVEKRAKGKQVTVVRNVTGDASTLVQALKKRCGAGGVARAEEIEIQGDHRAAIITFLEEQHAAGETS